LCGDAHLSNFGVYASPERALLFDVNDFHETLPGPFEYDVKRLAASFTIAARNNAFAKADVRAATMTSVAAYREAMADFAGMPTLDVWYAHLSEDELLTATRQAVKQVAKGKKSAKKASTLGKRAMQNVQKAHTRDSLQALSKLGEIVDGRYRIASMPPVVVPFRPTIRGLRDLSAQAPECCGSPVPGVPRDVAARPAPVAGAVRDRRYGS
jgi:hypothetical protein